MGQDLPDSDSTQERSWKINNCFVIIQLLSRVPLFVTPRTAAHQASLSITISLSLLKLMSIIIVYIYLLFFLFVKSNVIETEQQWINRHRGQAQGHGGGEGEMYGEIEVGTYSTSCKTEPMGISCLTQETRTGAL